MATPTSGGAKTKFTPSGKRNPCPVCGRVKDPDCRISPELVLCHNNTDHKVGDVIDGWAFTGVSSDGRTGKFTTHKPLKTQPEIFYGYSDTQRSKRYYKGGKKCFAVQHLVADRWKPGAGLDPWPLFFENEALAVLGSPESDGVVWEFEGEKCCELAVQGGLLAVSQPGHAHSPKQRAPRYQRLKDAGCTRLIYLADNDETGEKKAAEAVKGAELAGLTITVFRAQEVWPGLPTGGSIDDAPGDIEQRTALLRIWDEKTPSPDAASEPPPSDASMASAAETLGVTEQVAAGRDQFTFNRLLPPAMAAAVELVQEDLPSDPLSACLTFLVGLSGLLRIGTRASSSLRHHVPINLFFALVAWSGVAKSPQKRKLVERPAAGLIQEAREQHDRAMRQWRQQNKHIKRKEDRPPEPKCVLPHLTDYNAASLADQLMEHDKRGQPILLIRDELAGLLKAVEHDTKSGTGQAEAQLLELFEGDGYVSRRIEAGLRAFNRCHVSLFGCIQPEVLRELINGGGDGDDSTGKWARFLFCRLPARPLVLMDADPTQAEIDALTEAERTLQHYAEAAYRLPPKTYHLSRDARAYFHDWFRKHQMTALLPATPPVIRSMLMKTSAHALRLAGVLHVAQVLELGDAAPEKIGYREVETATAIVDQLHQETCLFHDRAESDELLLMRHVHALGERPDGCTWQWAKKKGGRKIRTMGAAKFAEAVAQLVAKGYGRRTCDQPLTYRALKPMTR